MVFHSQISTSILKAVVFVLYNQLKNFGILPKTWPKELANITAALMPQAACLSSNVNF